MISGFCWPSCCLRPSVRDGGRRGGWQQEFARTGLLCSVIAGMQKAEYVNVPTVLLTSSLGLAWGGILQKNRKIDDQRRIKTALPFCNILILKPPTYFKHRQLQLQRNVEAEAQVLLKTKISEENTQMKHLVIASRDFFSPLAARRYAEVDPVVCRLHVRTPSPCSSPCAASGTILSLW